MKKILLISLLLICKAYSQPGVCYVGLGSSAVTSGCSCNGAQSPCFQAYIGDINTAYATNMGFLATKSINTIPSALQLVGLSPDWALSDVSNCWLSSTCVYMNATIQNQFIDDVIVKSGATIVQWNQDPLPYIVAAEYPGTACLTSFPLPSNICATMTYYLSVYDAIYAHIKTIPGLTVRIAPLSYGPLYVSCGYTPATVTAAQAASCLGPFEATIISHNATNNLAIPNYVSVAHEPTEGWTLQMSPQSPYSTADWTTMENTMCGDILTAATAASVTVNCGAGYAFNDAAYVAYQTTAPNVPTNVNYVDIHWYYKGDPATWASQPNTYGTMCSEARSVGWGCTMGEGGPWGHCASTSGAGCNGSLYEGCGYIGLGASYANVNNAFALMLARYGSYIGTNNFTIFDTQPLASFQAAAIPTNACTDNTAGNYTQLMLQSLPTVPSTEGYGWLGANTWGNLNALGNVKSTGRVSSSGYATPNLCTPSSTGLPALSGTPGSTLAAYPAICYQPPYPVTTSTVTVTSGSASSLQNALSNAVCGEKIIVPANAIYSSSFIYGPTNQAPFGWQPSTAFTSTQTFVDSNHYLQQVTSGGTSGSTMPSWNETPAGTTTDNGVTWTNEGLLPQYCPNNPVLLVGSKINSLPQYENIPQSATPALVPTIECNSNGCTPLSISDGVSGIYIAGVELTLGSSAANVYPIVGMDGYNPYSYNVPSYITFDRVLVHPGPCSITAGGCNFVQAGIDLGANYGTVMYSQIWGIINTGQDTNAVSTSNNAGPILIAANYLEASGENVFMAQQCGNSISGSGTVNTSGTTVTWESGTVFQTSTSAGVAWPGAPITINGVVYTVQSVGSTTSLTLTTSAGSQPGVAYSILYYGWEYPYGQTSCPAPSDITIRLNHIKKQPTWRNNPSGCNPSIPSGCWDVKNSVEIKQGQRVLIDSNWIDTTFSEGQDNFIIWNCGINPTPSQICADIIVQNNLIAHGPTWGSAFGWLGYGPQNTNTSRGVIRNNVAIDLSGPTWGATGQVMSVQNTKYQVIDHNTFLNTPTTNLFDFVYADQPPHSNSNYQWTNSFQYGQPFADSDNAGQTMADWPNNSVPVTVGATVNVGDWFAYSGDSPAYPTGVTSLSSAPGGCQLNTKVISTCWAPDWALVGFTDFTCGGQGVGCANIANMSISGLTLTPSSAYHAGGTDGYDVGANIQAIINALSPIQW